MSLLLSDVSQSVRLHESIHTYGVNVRPTPLLVCTFWIVEWKLALSFARLY